jgi:hypothetical protein
MRRGSIEQTSFWLVALTLSALVVAPWWSSRLLPMMDYPMFLSFVRVLAEQGDASSPLARAYTVGSPVSPIALPLWLTVWASRGVGIETAGRMLHSAYALGLLGAAYWLIRETRGNRYNLVLLAPLVLGKWVSSGFVGFVTGMPWVLCTAYLTLRALRTPSRRREAVLAAALLVALLWHALVGALALLIFGVTWLIWRAPDLRARAIALWPLGPAVLALALWLRSSVLRPPPPGARPIPTTFASLTETLDPAVAFDRVLMLFDGSRAWAMGIGLVWLLAAALGARETETDPDFHLEPRIVWVLAALGCFLVLPANAFGVEIVNLRFLWVTALFAAIAWRWPRATAARRLSIAVVASAGATYLLTVNARFRAFDRETGGASRLVDRVPPRAVLFAPMPAADTASFGNSPLRELQQYATIRGGSLPLTSFAGYGTSYVQHRGAPLPPPPPSRGWEQHPELSRADYVLVRTAHLRSPRLRLVERDGEWTLYHVCRAEDPRTCPAP